MPTHVIDVMENISPKHIQDLGTNQKSTDAHPKAVREGSQGESNDEVWKERRHENDKRFTSKKIEEQPHDPCKEGAG